ncbi:Gfo/Idh/MocA family protein [Alkalihalobacillus trypoxylicola]|uniref:NAD(P)-dependent oxidoreductase n=1 Tax=Alkalihalobacillus trypoxylicola TaxID=519424 RepID=A0A161PKT2_9BACI|nr:Gfo/Idh/MocA family oxidoreductase [Alkalihalobacillus trypoxylicola]KYG34125.1 NAD(P)-dependent oxidoreductase [Alkalihalobacillus trypoxylicola]
MNLGIAGSGMIVQDVLKLVEDIPDIKVKGLFARSIEKVQALQNKHHIPDAFTNYEEMLSSQKIDTVYIGLPNHLHYQYAKLALLNGKHVICEKPFTSSLEEFRELVRISKERHLMLFEAISNQYQEMYLQLKNILPQLGRIKLVECNYSQFSSRYQDFKDGYVHPVFDPQKSGGALMDINIYNIHFVVGLFGLPSDVQYFPIIENQIDTAGVLVLDYGTFKSVCIGSKDSHATSFLQIQGENASLYIPNSANDIQTLEYKEPKKETIHMKGDRLKHRMYDEFIQFTSFLKTENYDEVERRLIHSENVLKVVEKAKAEG